jgi:hypothetical protein
VWSLHLSATTLVVSEHFLASLSPFLWTLCQRPLPRCLVVVYPLPPLLHLYLLVRKALPVEVLPDVVQDKKEDTMLIQLRRPPLNWAKCR